MRIGERYNFGVKILYNAANLKVRCLSEVLWHNALSADSVLRSSCRALWSDTRSSAYEMHGAADSATISQI